MTISKRLHEVNTINTIIAQAEREILAQTGLRIKLITINELLENEDPATVAISHIKVLELIANSMGLLYSDYSNSNRRKRFVMLRQIGVMLLRQYYPSITYEAIGTLYKQDHSSVINQHNVGDNLLQTQDELFCSYYNNALSAITQFLNE